MKNLFKISSPPVNNNITCIKKGYVDNGINLYPSQESLEKLICFWTMKHLETF